tara:strand:+ start:423 stop:596 length:174 start_codon:yes stop_codon:yes gene_type:complete
MIGGISNIIEMGKGFSLIANINAVNVKWSINKINSVLSSNNESVIRIKGIMFLELKD